MARHPALPNDQDTEIIQSIRHSLSEDATLGDKILVKVDEDAVLLMGKVPCLKAKTRAADLADAAAGARDVIDLLEVEAIGRPDADIQKEAQAALTAEKSL